MLWRQSWVLSTIMPACEEGDSLFNGLRDGVSAGTFMRREHAGSSSLVLVVEGGSTTEVK